MTRTGKPARVKINIKQRNKSNLKVEEVKKELSEVKQLLVEFKKQLDQLTKNPKETTFINLMDNNADNVQKIIGFLPTPAKASLAQVNRQCSKIVAENSSYQLENCLKNYNNNANSLLEIFYRPEHSQALAEISRLDLRNFCHKKPYENEFLVKLAQAIILKCPKLKNLLLSTQQIEILAHLKLLKNQLNSLSIDEKDYSTHGSVVDRQKLISLVSEFTELKFLKISVALNFFYNPPTVSLESWQHLKKITVLNLDIASYLTSIPSNLFNKELISLTIKNNPYLANINLINLGQAENLEFLDLSLDINIFRRREFFEVQSNLNQFSENFPYQNLKSINVQGRTLQLPNLNYQNLQILFCNNHSFDSSTIAELTTPKLVSLYIQNENEIENHSRILLDHLTRQCHLKNLSLANFPNDQKILELPKCIHALESLRVQGFGFDRNSFSALTNVSNLKQLIIKDSYRYKQELIIPEDANLRNLLDFSWFIKESFPSDLRNPQFLNRCINLETLVLNYFDPRYCNFTNPFKKLKMLVLSKDQGLDNLPKIDLGSPYYLKINEIEMFLKHQTIRTFLSEELKLGSNAILRIL